MPSARTSELLRPSERLSQFNSDYFWVAYTDRIEIVRKYVEIVNGKKKRKRELQSRMHLCKPRTRNQYSPDESRMAPVTDAQKDLIKRDSYKALMALRSNPIGWAHQNIWHIAHGPYVTFFSLESMISTGQGYRAIFTFEHTTPITHIGFADPDDKMTESTHTTTGDTPLCVRSLSEIVYLDEDGNRM
ncbi:MAG: hypothetical protein QGG83_05525 [Candidatus Woesearchaeota archaeon]|nr:hypothetical protein [Candidatus Woesearchaeota archaeon]MDP7647645.1 hypothetical protein [Candidatus Woesearchaeota archaeon]